MRTCRKWYQGRCDSDGHRDAPSGHTAERMGIVFERELPLPSAAGGRGFGMAEQKECWYNRGHESTGATPQSVGWRDSLNRRELDVLIQRELPVRRCEHSQGLSDERTSSLLQAPTVPLGRRFHFSCASSPGVFDDRVAVYREGSLPNGYHGQGRRAIRPDA